MKKSIFTIATLCISLLFTTFGFAQVKSDFDKNTDFTKFKTYSFEGWQKESDKQLNDFDKKRILEALKSEFEARGMKLVDSGADVGVAVFVVLDQKTSTTAYTNYTGGLGYGSRWGWGMGAGMGSATTTYNETDYLEGTLVVDVHEGKNLIWQGIITKTVNQKPEKREKSIPKNISKLMKKYPVAPTK